VSDDTNSLKAYLHGIVQFKAKIGLSLPKDYSYLGGEHYVLDRGSPLGSAPLTDDEMAFVMGAIANCPIKQFKLGLCYYNAQLLAGSDDTGRLRYTEGYACGAAGIPVLHGWVVLDGKKVIDLTWRQPDRTRRGKLADRVFGAIPDGWAYYGVGFDTEAVRVRIVRYKVAGSFLDDEMHDFPLYQEPCLRPMDELMKSHDGVG
jgi:hypothetical protein